MVASTGRLRLEAYASQVAFQRDMWQRHERAVAEDARVEFQIERRNLGTAKQYADQFRVIADRFNAVGTGGTLHERWREHQIQMHQAGCGRAGAAVFRPYSRVGLAGGRRRDTVPGAYRLSLRSVAATPNRGAGRWERSQSIRVSQRQHAEPEQSVSLWKIEVRAWKEK